MNDARMQHVHPGIVLQEGETGLAINRTSLSGRKSHTRN